MSLSPPTAAAFAAELTHAVVDGQEEEWSRLARELDQLSGRDWLVLDAAARSYRLNYSTPVSGVRGWLEPNLGEPSGLVAAVTSMHADGRFRERAALALAGMSGGIAVSAAAVRLLDHVEQVRTAASQSITALLVAQPDPDLLVRALDVILAGRDRFQGPSALETLERLGQRMFNKGDYVELLIGASARRVRRHGFKLANELGLLTVPRLLEAVRLEEDQLIVAWCADWLYERAVPGDLQSCSTPDRRSFARSRSCASTTRACLMLDCSNLQQIGLHGFAKPHGFVPGSGTRYCRLVPRPTRRPRTACKPHGSHPGRAPRRG